MQVRGITKEDVKKQVGANLAGMLRAEFSDPDTGATAQKMAKALEAGSSPEQVWKSLSATERDQADVLLRSRTGIGGEEASVLSGIFSGVGSKKKLKTGDALGARLTGMEAAEGKRAAGDILRTEDEIRAEAASGAAENILESGDVAKKLENFGSNLASSADSLATSLLRLSDVVSSVSDRLEGRAPSKGKAQAPQGGSFLKHLVIEK
jgi:hypothetical protein